MAGPRPSNFDQYWGGRPNVEPGVLRALMGQRNESVLARVLQRLAGEPITAGVDATMTDIPAPPEEQFGYMMTKETRMKPRMEPMMRPSMTRHTLRAPLPRALDESTAVARPWMSQTQEWKAR